MSGFGLAKFLFGTSWPLKFGPFSVFKVRLTGLDGPCTWSQEGRPQVVSPAPYLSEGRGKPSLGRRGSDPLLFASAFALVSGTPSATGAAQTLLFASQRFGPGDGFRDFGWGSGCFFLVRRSVCLSVPLSFAGLLRLCTAEDDSILRPVRGLTFVESSVAF